MNSLTIWLYVSSGVVIGLLSAFAIHNRRMGWKKPRTTLTEALDGLYADLGLSVDPTEEVEQSRHLMTKHLIEGLVDPSDFSDQLIRLTEALGETASQKPVEALASEPELMRTQVH